MITVQDIINLADALYQVGNSENLYFITYKEFVEALDNRDAVEIFRNDELVYRVKKVRGMDSYVVDYLPMNDSFRVDNPAQVLAEIAEQESA
jgi:hypothetical protein